MAVGRPAPAPRRGERGHFGPLEPLAILRWLAGIADFDPRPDRVGCDLDLDVTPRRGASHGVGDQAGYHAFESVGEVWVGVTGDGAVSDAVAKQVARALIAGAWPSREPMCASARSCSASSVLGTGGSAPAPPSPRTWRHRGVEPNGSTTPELSRQNQTYEHGLGLAEPSSDSVDVLRTDYVFKADGQPAMLSTSWESLDLTRGTPIVMPEEGPHAGRGVAERMLVIGKPITGWIETVGARLGTAEESAKLAHPPGSVMVSSGSANQVNRWWRRRTSWCRPTCSCWSSPARWGVTADERPVLADRSDPQQHEIGGRGVRAVSAACGEGLMVAYGLGASWRGRVVDRAPEVTL
jgi:hypothetical protein